MIDAKTPAAGQETGNSPEPENTNMTPCCRRNAEELGEGWLYDVFFGETGETEGEQQGRP